MCRWGLTRNRGRVVAVSSVREANVDARLADSGRRRGRDAGWRCSSASTAGEALPNDVRGSARGETRSLRGRKRMVAADRGERVRAIAAEGSYSRGARVLGDGAGVRAVDGMAGARGAHPEVRAGEEAGKLLEGSRRVAALVKVRSRRPRIAARGASLAGPRWRGRLQRRAERRVFNFGRKTEAGEKKTTTTLFTVARRKTNGVRGSFSSRRLTRGPPQRTALRSSTRAARVPCDRVAAASGGARLSARTRAAWLLLALP